MWLPYIRLLFMRPSTEIPERSHSAVLRQGVCLGRTHDVILSTCAGGLVADKRSAKQHRIQWYHDNTAARRKKSTSDT